MLCPFAASRHNPVEVYSALGYAPAATLLLLLLQGVSLLFTFWVRLANAQACPCGVLGVSTTQPRGSNAAAAAAVTCWCCCWHHHLLLLLLVHPTLMPQCVVHILYKRQRLLEEPFWQRWWGVWWEQGVTLSQLAMCLVCCAGCCCCSCWAGGDGVPPHTSCTFICHWHHGDTSLLHHLCTMCTCHPWLHDTG